ncbi:YqiA/YcfP family alpha/beta fold hydrolase [Teredinibacter purpureus]|uniref:YqiA/YcfP family alpha/beta fold hydrolase n=1 Tax=Teredinibacter purpureus TaxID=2731756 RepID=UPI0005F7A870|nr:YqiA/YcfP family alpha/beta fold hydrolase [Teredinibacter purpureus]
MTTVLYIHGFLSSPQSHKARITAEWLAKKRPEFAFLCPALSSYPNEAAATLAEIMLQRQHEKVLLIGSSLGGFWATWLIEEYTAAKAVLINPAVAPQELVAPLVGQPLKSYYTEHTYCLQAKHVQYLVACDQKHLSRPEDYWLMVQTGDETLDYRQAVTHYSGCKQTVEAGGDHGFQQYEKWLPEIIEFLER